MRAIKAAAGGGGVMRGPRGGLYKMVGGKRVSVKKGAKPTSEAHKSASHLDAHLAREQKKFGDLVRGNPMAAMRALGKMHPEGAKAMHGVLARGLAKVLGNP